MSCPYPSTDRPPAWSRAHRTDGAGQRAPFFTSRKNTVKNHRDLVSTDTTLRDGSNTQLSAGLAVTGGLAASLCPPFSPTHPSVPSGLPSAPAGAAMRRAGARAGCGGSRRAGPRGPAGGGVPLPALSLPLSHGFGSARALRPAFGRAHGGEL